MQPMPQTVSMPLFRERVRAAREMSGLTQSDLAEICGLDRKTINRIERGVGSPSLEAADRVATALGLRLSALLDETVRWADGR